MALDKNKIWLHRGIWLIVLIVGIMFCIIPPVEPELVDYSCTISNYYTYLDQTACEIDLTFDKDVGSCSVIVRFYDSTDKFLGEKDLTLLGVGKTAYDHYFIVDGEVDSYEIMSYSVTADNGIMITIGCMIVFIGGIMFVSMLTLSCKEYDYQNMHIRVYAGCFHHALFVNDEKCDEHNTLITYTPIYLSTTLPDGTKVDVSISTFNRITVKCNNKLIHAGK